MDMSAWAEVVGDTDLEPSSTSGTTADEGYALSTQSIQPERGPVTVYAPVRRAPQKRSVRLPAPGRTR